MSAPSRAARLVVVGNGMAGARLVDDVIARDPGGHYEIVVFGDDLRGSYDRVLLSGVLAGSYATEDILRSTYARDGVTMHAGERVTGIDRKRKVIGTARGLTVPYDTLVFATGSAPLIPRLERLHLESSKKGEPRDTAESGKLREGVFVFRTLDDCDRIAAFAKSAKKVAVLGGGLLGLEAARGLVQLGLEVHVIHAKEHLMELQLDKTAGAMLRRRLEALGVHVHVKKTTVGLLGNGRVSGLLFHDAETIDCDMLVIAAGIRPRTELARDAGIEVERGIVVDDTLVTSDPNVFAIGECAQHRGRTYGFLAPLWAQSNVLADRLTNARPDATYRGSRVAAKLNVMGIDLVTMGDREASRHDDDEVTYVEPSRGVYKKIVVRDGRIIGGILLGDPIAASRILTVFEQQTDVPLNRAELLFPQQTTHQTSAPRPASATSLGSPESPSSSSFPLEELSPCA